MATVIYSEVPGAQGAPYESTIRRILEPAGHNVCFVDEPLTPETASAFAEAEAVSVSVHSKVNSTVLPALPKLRVINARSKGFDHVDRLGAESAGIQFSYVPDYSDAAVADQLFRYFRHVDGEAIDFSEMGRHTDIPLELPASLVGRSWGIIGCGATGRHLAIKLQQLGVPSSSIHAYHPRRSPGPDSHGVNFTSSLPNFLTRSDVVSVHCPLREETRGLLHPDVLDHCRLGMVLCNLARGPIVRNDFLEEGLRSGIVSRAFCDVMEGCSARYHVDHAELVGADSLSPSLREYMADGRLLVSPHTAFCTHEAFEHLAKSSALQMRRDLARSA